MNYIIGFLITFIFVSAALVTIFGVNLKDVWPYICRLKEKLFYENDNPTSKENPYSIVSKQVSFNYPKESGLQDKWEKEGYNLRWISPRKVESMKLQGFSIMYGIDEEKKQRFFLECLSSRGKVDLIMMGKKIRNESL
jgi:hypothetical protein